MPKPDSPQLTAQQRKWFASVQGGLERETGKSLAQWVAIAKTCPATAPRARLRWFKETHGLLQNRASYVLNEAFPPEVGWSEPDALRESLWTDPASRAVLAEVESLVLKLPDVVTGQRKGFSAWSRKYQFAALRPVRGGAARLGLALAACAHPMLEATKNEAWSERLKAAVILPGAGAVDRRVEGLLRRAWEES